MSELSSSHMSPHSVPIVRILSTKCFFFLQPVVPIPIYFNIVPKCPCRCRVAVSIEIDTRLFRESFGTVNVLGMSLFLLNIFNFIRCWCWTVYQMLFEKSSFSFIAEQFLERSTSLDLPLKRQTEIAELEL